MCVLLLLRAAELATELTDSLQAHLFQYGTREDLSKSGEQLHNLINRYQIRLNLTKARKGFDIPPTASGHETQFLPEEK